MVEPLANRRIGTALYAPTAVAAVLSQHAAVAIIYSIMGLTLSPGVEFWLLPLRTLARIPDLPPAALAAGLGFSILSAGLVAALSLWRARDAGSGYLAAASTVVPVWQVVAIAVLSVLPRSRPGATPGATRSAAHVGDILGGFVAGMGICVFAVAVSALAFRTYGWGLFVLAPLLMGWVTGYLANRRVLLSSGDTFKLVFTTASLGGLMLIVFALEGFICLLMAAPLAILAAWFGGTLGRDMAIQRGDKANPMMMSVAVLPLVFALEASVPAQLTLASQESIEIDAPPAAVWSAITASRDLMPGPTLPFRLGLAYPVSSELRGEGVGAERVGRFSTGLAHERVTVWSPGRQLAFKVLDTPPVMRELSPWRTVHAPHVVGYFQTEWTSFEMLPLPGARTRLSVRSAHSLRLDPAPYWEPMAAWAIRVNNRRVLAHFKARSEASVAVTVAQAPPSTGSVPNG